MRKICSILQILQSIQFLLVVHYQLNQPNWVFRHEYALSHRRPSNNHKISKRKSMIVFITSLLSTVIIKIACDRELCSFIFVALKNVIWQKQKEFEILPCRSIEISRCHNMFDFLHVFRNKWTKIVDMNTFLWMFL